jgi:lysophospholipase L1-like esterase
MPPLPARAVELTPPQISDGCRAPMSDIAAPAPLPHLAAVLEGRRQVRVMAIGSSSTVGVGASAPDKAYPPQFESILEHSIPNLDVLVINRGVSGEVAAATAARLRAAVVEDRPDLVLWQVGTNDALQNVPVESFTETLQTTVRWLKDRSIDVALVGLQYSPRTARDPRHGAIRGALRQVAAAERVLWIRRFEAMEFVARHGEGNLISPDGLHQNDLGYRCMAEYIARAVMVSAFPDELGATRN